MSVGLGLLLENSKPSKPSSIISHGDQLNLFSKMLLLYLITLELWVTQNSAAFMSNMKENVEENKIMEPCLTVLL